MINVPHQVKDLQMIINVCSALVKNSTDFIDHTDYYNIQSYCKKLRNKRETNFRAIRPRTGVSISMNINELRSLEKLYDLNYVFFNDERHIYERLMFTGFLEPYMKFKVNHIYNPF